MPDWLVILLGISASLGPIAGGAFIAKRYERMGGGAVQLKLNASLKELNEAYEDKLQQRDAELREMHNEMQQCKGRLEVMESKEERWMAERIELKSELAAVYRRLGMTPRASILDDTGEPT